MNLEELATRQISRKHEAVARNRAQFPAVAKLLDEVREVFPHARIVWAQENGKEIGRKQGE